MSPITTRKEGEVLVVLSNNPPVNALSQPVRLAPTLNGVSMSTERPMFWTGTRAFDTVEKRLEPFSAGSGTSALLREKAASRGRFAQ